MSGKLLLAAWAVVLATVAGTAGWLALGDEGEPPQTAALVLAIPPQPAAAPATIAAADPVAPPPEAKVPEIGVSVPAAPPVVAEPTKPAAPPASARTEPSPPPAAKPAPPQAATPEAIPPGQSRAASAGKAGTPAARATATPTSRPQIAVAVTGLGIAEAVTRRAVEELPAGVTLAFLPFVENVGEWVKRARAAGHQVLLNLPMEPVDYPRDDPGPKALLTALSAGQNLERLDWVLGRASDYVGVMNVMGSRFLASEEDLRPVLSDLRDRGLIFVDSGSTPRSVATTLASDLRLSRAVSDRVIDSELSRAGIVRRLQEIEQIAREVGVALAVARPYPVTISAIAEWARTLPDRGFTLTPVSAIADRQWVK